MGKFMLRRNERNGSNLSVSNHESNSNGSRSNVNLFTYLKKNSSDAGIIMTRKPSLII